MSVELTPGLTVTVQGLQYSRRAEFDKIVVPFGAHPDQVTNLLDIAARDVFHKFFESNIYRICLPGSRTADPSIWLVQI
jgi:hypothetical protein